MRELPKCDRDTQREPMLVEERREWTGSMQSCHQPSTCKKAASLRQWDEACLSWRSAHNQSRAAETRCQCVATRALGGQSPERSE